MKALGDYLFKGLVFNLEDGREIRIVHLEQKLTYGHVLEGILYGPHYEGDVRIHYDMARQRYPGRKIIVIKPRLRPLAIADDKLEKLRSWWEQAKVANAKERSGLELTPLERARSGYPEPVCIGSVCCTALFESTPIDKKVGMLSELFVIWFQDGFALPIDPDIVEEFMTFDWANLAEDTDI